MKIVAVEMDDETKEKVAKVCHKVIDVFVDNKLEREEMAMVLFALIKTFNFKGAKFLSKIKGGYKEL